MFAESATTYYIYMRYMRFKLVILCFMLPFMALVYVTSVKGAGICSSVLSSYKMTPEEI